MIGLEKYIRRNNIWFKNFDDFIIVANRKFYNYIIENGIELNLKSKDQQNLIFHFILIETCEYIKLNKNIIYYSNNWTTHDNYLAKFIKKITKIFGIRIYTEWVTFEDFIIKLQSFDTKFIEQFELFLEKDIKPKSFKQIKKFLEREGFTDLAENYFQDNQNKMTICG